MTDPVTVWAVESYRAGETSQVLGLAEGLQRSLGGTLVTKRLQYTPWAGARALAWRIGLTGLARAARTSLAPPWPDVLIVAGARNEPIARWIKQASGGHTFIVFIGRTWAPIRHFDLLVTTPQYRVPRTANVLENNTTLHRITPARLFAARAEWQQAFANLPQPRLAVLVGGDSGPHALRANTAHKLAQALQRWQHATAGALLITTSSRTHPAAAAALTAALPAAYLYRWDTGMGKNPYFGLLAWADEILVTSDSIAMLSEALAVGVPVSLFDLSGRTDDTFKARMYRALMRLGPERLSRDIGVAHARLLHSGAIAQFGGAAASTTTANSAVRATATPQVDDALQTTIERIARGIGRHVLAPSTSSNLAAQPASPQVQNTG